MNLQKINKKYLVILALVAMGAIWYFFFRKKEEDVQSPETKSAQTQAQSGAAYNAGTQETIQAVELDAETEKYNLARQEYYNLTGGYPKSSWSINQINAAIEDVKKKNEAIDRLVSINASVDLSDANEWTTADVENMIKKEEQAKAQREKDAKKAAWAGRKPQLNTIVENFRKTILDDGNAMAQKAFDTGALNAVRNLNDAELCYANGYFRDTGGLSISDNYGAAKKTYTTRMTLSTAFANGNRTNWRAGSSTAISVRDFLKGKEYLWAKTVNEYGEIV